MMKKRNLLHLGVLALLLTACSTTPQSGKQEGQIDIVPAFENQTELKVSHLGKNIRYVPLETNDSSLIGGTYGIKLQDDMVVVTTSGNCLLFDKHTGKFLRKIGSKGQGPKEYLDNIPYIHPETGDIYFNRTPEKMIRFNRQGEFLGELELPFQWDEGCYLSFQGNQVFAHLALWKDKLYRFDTDGTALDSIVLPANREADFKDIKQPISIAGPLGVQLGSGLFATNGMFLIQYKSGERQDILPVHHPSIYTYGDEMRFHEAYNDTVYAIEEGLLTPRWIFRTGEYHFPRELYGDVAESEKRMVVTYVGETEELLFFECAKGWFAPKKVELCNGIYRKKTGTVMIGKRNEGFLDDLTLFIPFKPLTHSAQGEFAGALNIEDIQKWTEEHPDIKLEGALAPLKDLADDANPVVVIVEP